MKNLFLDKSVAENYDAFYNTSRGREIDNIEKEIISELLDRCQGIQMLELGCGTGHWTEYFSAKGFSVTAIDNSDEMLKIARDKKIKNADFIKSDAASLPLGDNSFSLIVTITMLEFVEDPAPVLKEINRLLKPGGRFISGCLNENSELGRTKNNDEVFRNARFFTPAEVERYLSKIGKPDLRYGIYLSPEFTLLDGTPHQNSVKPAFIAASVQKI